MSTSFNLIYCSETVNFPAATSQSTTISETTVLLSQNDYELEATLTQPVDQTAQAAVVLLQGWSGTRIGPHRLLVRLARQLAERGVVALRYDMAGRGYSDGDADTADLDQLITDAISAKLCLQKVLLTDKLFYIGICSGGNVALGAAANDDCQGLVLLSTLPFSARTEVMAKQKRQHFLRIYLRKALSWRNWWRLLKGEASVSGVTKVMKQAGQEDAIARRLKDSRQDIPALLADKKLSACFIYGSGDPEAVAAADYYKLLQQRSSQQNNAEPSQNLDFSYYWIEAANHNFYAQAWSKEAESQAINFIMERLR